MAWTFKGDESLPVKFLPASAFPWEELTHAYNQTRVDYIVPMPMNVARLREYTHNYSVELNASVVAVEDGQITGLAMLGVRPGHTWVTRLGVLPISRQHGMGRFLMQALIEQSCHLGVGYVVLEVIRGNEPAYRLFKKLGFRDRRELLIMRRPPGPPATEWGRVLLPMPYMAQVLDYHHAIAQLQQYRGVLPWLNEPASLENMGNITGLQVELKHGGRGWIVYQNTVFQLGHMVMQTDEGDPREVGQALLHALHTRHPAQDTSTENVAADDPHLPAMWDLKYLESFRRIEMRLDF